MVDIVDIRSAVKKGNIRFVVDKNKIFCEGVGSGERVCVNDNLVLPKGKEVWVEMKPEDNPIRHVIVLDKGDGEVYFKYICCGSQGKFDGEILFTPYLAEAAKYDSEVMIESQLDSVKFSLKKNPNLSNPRIRKVIKKEV
jgi:hypothetical protein